MFLKWWFHWVQKLIFSDKYEQQIYTRIDYLKVPGTMTAHGVLSQTNTVYKSYVARTHVYASNKHETSTPKLINQIR